MSDRTVIATGPAAAAPAAPVQAGLVHAAPAHAGLVHAGPVQAGPGAPAPADTPRPRPIVDCVVRATPLPPLSFSLFGKD